MKVQSCQYRIKMPPTKKDGRVTPGSVSGWLTGVALVDSYGDGSAIVIVDRNLRQLSREPYDWRMVSGPLSFIDTDWTVQGDL